MTDKISLKKGSSEKISLKKVAPALKELRLEFSWKSDSKLDLDVSALVCRHNAAGNPEMLSARHLVCYANKFDPERYTFAGDDVRDGTGSMEQIDITLAKISPDAQEIAFVLTIDDDTGLKRFGHASEGMLKIFDSERNVEILDFDFLAPEVAGNTICHVASLVREDGEWKLKAYGVGKAGLDICDVVMAFGGKKEWYECP